MKRVIALVLCLFIGAVLLTGCSKNEEPQALPMDFTQAIGPVETPDPYAAANSVDDTDEWAPDDAFTAEMALSEEEENYDYDPYVSEYVPEEEDNGFSVSFDYSAATTVYPYAGSTPIPLEPVDKPTPTPRPALNFTYTQYNATNIGLTFEGPAGWITDESDYQTIVLRESYEQMKDGVCCEIVLSAEPVSETYSQKNLSTYVKQRMETIKNSVLSECERSNTANRYMLGKQGVYLNYTGKLADGSDVGGRILYVCIDKTLYGLEIMYPLGYKDDFLNAYGKIRQTVKTVK